MAAIDDARSSVVAAHFREREESLGYLQLVHDMVEPYGCPLALYRDRHRIFAPSDSDTIDDQLLRTPALTQVGRILVGIHVIPAHSPQAKRRVECLFGTFQDRRYVELQLNNITTIPEANAALPDFAGRRNARFARVAAEPGSAYAPLAPHIDLAGVRSLKAECKVANDNTVQFKKRRIQVLPGPQRLSYARCQVDVQQRVDGSLVIVYQGEPVALQLAPTPRPSSGTSASASSHGEPPQDAPRDHLAAWKTRPPVPTPPRSIPARNHPWRHGFKRRVTQS